MGILLIEDDASIAAFIAQGFGEAGHPVHHVDDGRAGLALARDQRWDCIILDRMLPGLDGAALVSEVRRVGVTTPVLMLSARGAVDDRVEGLEAGADDYLIKPFAFSECLARVRALLRRAPPVAAPVLRAGALTLDPSRHRAAWAGTSVELTAREFALLAWLMRHRGRVLSRTRIIEQIWGDDFAGDTNVIEVYVGYLRRKLERSGAPPLIQTVRGVGYRLVDDDAAQ
jgi:DNA-binding response OmpR family regulator